MKSSNPQRRDTVLMAAHRRLNSSRVTRPTHALDKYMTQYHTLVPTRFRYFTFIRTSGYLRAAARLLADAEEREIERVLCENPWAGDTVAHAGGVAKLRVKLPGAGKSGGARLIYFCRGSVGRIYLLYVYGKGEQETISADEKKELCRLTTELEDEP